MCICERWPRAELYTSSTLSNVCTWEPAREDEGALSREVYLCARATCDLGRSASTHAQSTQNWTMRLRAATAVCRRRAACVQRLLRVQKRLRATR